MTQTYINRAAVHWMREGLCPECGNRPEEHETNFRDWVTPYLRCRLTRQAAVARIARQREIDDELEDT